MRRLSMFLLLLLVACAPVPVGDYVPGRILVKWRPGTVLKSEGETIDPLGIQILDVGLLGKTTLQDQLESLLENPQVEWAELDYLLSAFETPNDPYYPRQWHLPKIDVPQAWDITKGTKLVVAIIDTGIDLKHSDLKDQIVPGWDFVNNDAIPADDQGHGTHVAGIVAATHNNGIGVTGVCPECRLMGVKVLNSSGSGATSAIARGIVWATQNGARIINMSLGGPQFSNTLRDAVDYASNNGVLVIAAAGNSGTSQCSYPACYKNVMAVAATDSNDRPASFTNYGNWVSVAAPGVSIASTCLGGQYCFKSGTSMASPVVAGLAGLVAARYLSESPVVWRYTIEQTARDLGARMGKGRVNAANAVRDGSSPGPTPGITPTSSPISDVAKRTEQLIAQYRADKGLSALREDERLEAAARGHSQDMRNNVFCSHTGSDGSSPFDRAVRAGYPNRYVGEIIACGYNSAEEAVQGWKLSSGHDTIMRGRQWTDFGCGYAEGGRLRKLYTCAFGQSQLSPYPTVTPQPTQMPSPTSTSQPEGFWLWCQGSPLMCEERGR